MKKQNGVTLIALVVTIIIMMILVGITTYIGKDLIKEAKLQDLKTDMLLIQAEGKKGLEEVVFQKLSLTEEEDAESIKNLLFGTKIYGDTEATEVINALNNLGEKYKILDEEKYKYYYLNEEQLESIGMDKFTKKDKDGNYEYGYFVLKYDIDNIDVQVINTIGYNGKYELEELISLDEE